MKSTAKLCRQVLQDQDQLLTYTMDGSDNCAVLAAECQSIVEEGHQAMATFRNGVFNLEDHGMSFGERVSTLANERFAKGCVLFKNHGSMTKTRPMRGN